MALEGIQHILRNLDVPDDLARKDAATRVVDIVAKLMGAGFSMALIRRLLGGRRQITIEMIEALGNGALRMLNDIHWETLDNLPGEGVAGGRHAHIELRLRTIDTVNDVNAYVDMQVEEMVARIEALHVDMEVEQADPLYNIDATSNVSVDDL